MNESHKFHLKQISTKVKKYIFLFCSTCCIWDCIIILTHQDCSFWLKLMGNLLSLAERYGKSKVSIDLGSPFIIEHTEDQSNISDMGSVAHTAAIICLSLNFRRQRIRFRKEGIKTIVQCAFYGIQMGNWVLNPWLGGRYSPCQPQCVPSQRFKTATRAQIEGLSRHKFRHQIQQVH